MKFFAGERHFGSATLFLFCFRLTLPKTSGRDREILSVLQRADPEPALKRPAHPLGCSNIENWIDEAEGRVWFLAEAVE